MVKQLNHEYLCDNFAIPKVITKLQEFIKLVNIYISKNQKSCKYTILFNSTQYVNDILHCMGMEYGNTEGGNEQNKLIQTIVDLRKEMRDIAKKHKVKELFEIGDKYRDIMLNDFLVQIEDKENRWK